MVSVFKLNASHESGHVLKAAAPAAKTHRPAPAAARPEATVARNLAKPGSAASAARTPGPAPHATEPVAAAASDDWESF